MATKAKRHVHKYHWLDIGYSNVWACALPDCNHYMPRHMEKTILGKFSVCWGCGDKMTLDEDALKQDKPQCFKCRTGVVRVENTVEPISNVLKEYLAKLES